MIVEADSRANFAYVLPGPPDEPTKIVIPSALQMGWCESPGYFCAATESARDMAHHWIDEDKPLPVHGFEEFVRPTNAPRRQTSPGPNYQLNAVYVDDFIMAAVQSHQGTFWKRQAGRHCMPSTACSHRRVQRTHQGQKTRFRRRSLPKGMLAGTRPKKSWGTNWMGYRGPCSCQKQSRKLS